MNLKSDFAIFAGNRGKRLLLAYFAIGFAHPAMISFVFMQYVFYDAMIAVMGITNFQLGFLITIEGAGAIILALPIGMLVDRFDCNKVLYASWMASALASAAFALVPTYEVALVAWAVLSVTMCGFIPGVYKIVRIIVPADSEGKSYGAFGFFTAIGFMVINFVSLAVYSWAADEFGLATGLSIVLWLFAIVLSVSATIAFLVIRTLDYPGDEAKTVKKISLRDVVGVAKMPGTWLVFIICFTINTLHMTVSYFTPYFTGVLGATIAFSGAFAVIRQYGVRLLIAPFGGWLGDRIRSNTKIITVAFLVASVLIMIVIGLPAEISIAVVVLVVLGIAVVDNLLIPMQYAACREALIPPKYMGTVVGLTTIILPDLFVPSMYGNWLDVYGNGGYVYIFLFSIALNLVAVVAGVVILRRFKKAGEAEKRSVGL